MSALEDGKGYKHTMLHRQIVDAEHVVGGLKASVTELLRYINQVVVTADIQE